jgi:two-component system, response regulator PdtaR
MSNSSCKQPITILLVDGEAVVRVSTAYLLENKGGFQVIEALSADEAILYLSSRPDIQGLITEVRIPGSLNGFALARAASERWPHIAIIITSRQQEPQPEEIPDDAVFLQKPYNSEKLISTIAPLITME